MIVGEEPTDSGTLAVGETVELAYVDQSRDALDPEKTVWEEISDGYEHIKVGDQEVNSRAYVAGFNFKGSDQQRKVGALSGGERNRVHLAKLLRRGGNTLLLDEPTNDLDVDTLRALEEALLAFPGCAVIISHDRWFLDRVATHVLAFEGDSQVTWFEGTSRSTRRTGTPGSARRPTGRTGSPTRSSSAASSRRNYGAGRVIGTDAGARAPGVACGDAHAPAPHQTSPSRARTADRLGPAGHRDARRRDRGRVSRASGTLAVDGRSAPGR
jgi:energy-coupling factor transporter ATP-binding protein EcfA2